MKLPRILAAGQAATVYFSSGEPIRIAAAATDGGPPRFDMVAYTGGTLKLKGYPLPLIVDLKGLEGTDRSRPALRDHDQTKPVGHTDAIVNDGRRLTATGVMSVDSTVTRETVEAAKDSFPWQTSIGADPLALRLVKAGERVRVNGREFEGPVIVATRSRLREISFVAIGADDGTSAKIAASAAEQEFRMTFAEWLKSKGFDESTISATSKQFLQAQYDAEIQAAADDGAGDDAAGDGGGSDSDPQKVIQASLKLQRIAAAGETKRIAAIAKVFGGKLPEIEAKAIEEGWTVDKAELEALRNLRPQAPAGHVASREVKGDVIEAAMCMSLGVPDVEKQFKAETLEAAHKSLRNVGLQQVLMITACANGYAGVPGERVHSGNIEDVLMYAFPRRGPGIQAGFSTISLPGIFSNVANKELLAGYMEEDQTWREVAQVKSVADFKQVTSYRLLDDMEYEELPPDGEMRHGTLGEESYTRQAKTYAKMFALSRTSIINDDIGAFDDLRNRLGRGGAKKFNNVFWAKFLDNSSFFTSGRGNYFTGATTNLGSDGVGLETGVKTFRLLTSPTADGAKRVGGRPEILLVPPELEFIADRLYQSANVNTGGSSTAASVPNANIHAGKYRPVVNPWLSDSAFTGYSATAWYLLRNPAQGAAMVVSYLNGQQAPTVESTDADFNRLGIQFRGYHDWGCDQAEYLAGVKSKGAA